MKLQTTYQLITPVLTVPHILFVMTFKLHRVFLCKCERFHTSVRWNYRCWPLIVNGREEEQLDIISNCSRSHIGNQRGGEAVTMNLINPDWSLEADLVHIIF